VHATKIVASKELKIVLPTEVRREATHNRLSFRPKSGAKRLITACHSDRNPERRDGKRGICFFAVITTTRTAFVILSEAGTFAKRRSWRSRKPALSGAEGNLLFAVITTVPDAVVILSEAETFAKRRSRRSRRIPCSFALPPLFF
jgi:hypothetical protein